MRISEFIGVYDADGGWRGEVAYVVGHMLGTRNCALCDVTHAAVRRKPEWDAMVRDLGVPFTLVHRNEMAPDVAHTVGTKPLALVLARTDESLAVILDADDLILANGSVAAFEAMLRDKVAELGY